MSFNVLAPKWLDSLLKRSASKETISAEYRYARTIELIKRRRPDIIFLQEASNALLAQLPKTYTVACTQCTVRNQHPCTAIAIRNTLPLEDIECIPMNFVNNYKFTVMTARLRQTASASRTARPIKLLLASIHLEYDDIKTERQQLRKFLDKMAPLVRQKGMIVVLAGDFNCETACIADITKPYTDVVNGRRTHPNADEPQQSISKFLLKGDIDVVSSGTGRAKDLRETLKRYGSDHFPVYATVRV